MHSTLNPKPSDDPHDVIVVAPDVVRVAPSDEEISHLLQQAARFHSEAQARAASVSPAGPKVPPVDTTFRPAAVNDVLGSGRGPSFGKRAVRAFGTLLLAACIGGAAIAWQASGYAAKKTIAKWAPQFILTSLPLEKWGLSEPSTPPDEETAATPPQPAPLAETAQEGAAANAAVPAPDSTQSRESMARELANATQEVEQLKATIAQLKANQRQMPRDVAKSPESRVSESKPSEQAARPKIAAIPPRPAVAQPRKPAPPNSPAQAYPPAQTAAVPVSPQAAAPYVPRQPEPQPPSGPAQLPAAPGFDSVPRPPMPVQ
jgi:hypothetical protein